jgi:hypothetical protein
MIWAEFEEVERRSWEVLGDLDNDHSRIILYSVAPVDVRQDADRPITSLDVPWRYFQTAAQIYIVLEAH